MSRTTDERRLGGVARVYGEEGASALNASHVLIAGMGGVGSWAAEAIVRSGVGRVTLIDGDLVERSNSNRQLHAMEGNFGYPKVEILRKRFLKINPDAQISANQIFITAENVGEMLPDDVDWVLDCIDDLKSKTALVATTKGMGFKIAVSGGAGGKRDPSRLMIEDLARAKGDPLLAKLRTNLRKAHGFPAGNPSKPAKKFGIPVVVTDELVRQPDEKNAAAIGSDTARGIGFGAAMVVTASVGLMLASIAINEIVGRAQQK